MNCPHCGAPVQEDWNFCLECHKPIHEESSKPSSFVAPASFSNSSASDAEKAVDSGSLRVVKNRALWNIAQGEIAYHVRETEIERFEHLRGLVIEEGVTAEVYVNGKWVVSLDGGTYDFVDQDEIDKRLKERVSGSGVVGMARSFTKGFINFILGKRVGDKIGAYHDNSEIKDMDDVVRLVNESTMFSIYLKRDEEFQLLFGTQHSYSGDERPEFVPFTVRAGWADVNVGVSLMIKIEDFHAFMRSYLLGRESCKVNDIQRQIEPDVRRIVEDVLAGQTIDERGLTAELRERIAQKLMSLNTMLNGLRIVRVANVTTLDEDMERFRQLSKELYMSERELEYAHRTMEVRNKLAVLEGKQKIDDARSEQELREALYEIKRQHLLSDDDMAEFQEKLMNHQLQRENLSKILEMVSEAEVLKKKISLEQDLSRDRLKAESELNQMKQEEGFRQDLADARHQKDMLAEEIGGRRMVDAYTDERERVALSQQKAKNDLEDDRVMRQESDRLEILRQKQMMALSAQERLEQMRREREERAHRHKMDERQMEIANEQYQGAMSHEERMAEIDLKKYSTEKDTELMRERMNDRERMHMTMEQERRQMMEQQQMLYQQMMAQQQQQMQQMMGFSQQAMQTQAQMAAQMAGARQAEQEALHQEYRDELHHQQQRNDHTQDQALNYTSQVTRSAMAPQQPLCPHQQQDDNQKK